VLQNDFGPRNISDHRHSHSLSELLQSGPYVTESS
jgi:hypothetical protein